MHRIIPRSLLFLAFSLCLAPAAAAQGGAVAGPAASPLEALTAALSEAKTPQERAALLDGAGSSVTVELRKALIERGNALQGRGDFPRALGAFRAAQAVAEKIGDRQGAAYALNGIGGVLMAQGDPTQSLGYREKSLALAEELGDRELEARVLGNIGVIHRVRGETERALEFFRRSKTLADELGNRQIAANALGNIGNVYAVKGALEPAVEHYRMALAEHRALGNKLGVSTQLNNVGIIQTRQGDADGALKTFGESLRLSEEIGDREGVGLVLYNIGNVYKMKGDYTRALEHYSRSLSVSKELGAKPGVLGALINIGSLYYEQGDYAQSVKYTREALALAEEMESKYGQGVALSNLAAASRSQGDLPRALEYYGKAAEVNKEGGVALDGVLIGMGTTYFAHGDYARALEHYEKAREVAAPDLMPEVLTLMAEAHFGKGQHREALEAADRSAELATRTGTTAHLWRAHTAAGRALRALGRDDEARRRLEEAVASVEAARSGVVGGEREQAQFFEGKVSPYHEIIDLLVSQGDAAAALAFAERSKARALLDVLRSGRVSVAKAMTPGERERERRLNTELVSLNAQLSAERGREKPDQQLLDGLRARAEKVRLDYESFKTGLYATHPALKTLRGEAHPVGVEEAGELLPDASIALLEYVVTEGKTYLFVLTKGEGRAAVVKAYPVGAGRKECGERVESYRRMLAEGDLNFRAPGRELYDLLLKPAEAQLRGKQTLVFVPDGALWELPFAALQPSPQRYLLEDSAVFYAPSLTVLREMKKARGVVVRPKTAPSLLAFGDPLAGARTPERAKATFADETLGPLPEAGRQVAALAQLYGAKNSRVYTGAAAREETVKAEAPAFRVLQFATHGVLDDASPMYSHLLLSRAAGSGEDGRLEAWEVMEMDLDADLVVLSACETARGRYGAGEGIVGMSWAFFIAGSPATVVSQWKVESESTMRLMLEFHRQLISGRQSPRTQLSKARALQQAALKLLKSPVHSHPSYWAGLVMVGDGY